MAFPSSSGSLPITLEAGWEAARALAASIKSQSQALLAQGQGAGIRADVIVSFSVYLAASYSQLATIAGISGIAAYGQQQVGSSTLDVAAAFTAMQTAVSNTIGWITANFPHDTNGNLLYTQFAANGSQTFTTFTAAQLTGFVTQLNALIATID